MWHMDVAKLGGGRDIAAIVRRLYVETVAATMSPMEEASPTIAPRVVKPGQKRAPQLYATFPDQAGLSGQGYRGGDCA